MYTTVLRCVLLYSVLILLYVCPHTTKCIAVEGAAPTSICGLILLCIYWLATLI